MAYDCLAAQTYTEKHKLSHRLQVAQVRALVAKFRLKHKWALARYSVASLVFVWLYVWLKKQKVQRFFSNALILMAIPRGLEPRTY